MVEILEKQIAKKKRVVRKRPAKKAAPATEREPARAELSRADHFNSIGKSVGTACVIMTALVITIAPPSVWILGPVIGAMAIFGIAMGYFASK